MNAVRQEMAIQNAQELMNVSTFIIFGCSVIDTLCRKPTSAALRNA